MSTALVFISLYILPILAFSWFLSSLLHKRHPRWPRFLLITLFTLMGLFFAPILDHGDIKILGWKIWSTLQGRP